LVLIRHQPFLRKLQVLILSEQILQQLHGGRNRTSEDTIEDPARPHCSPDDPGKAEGRVVEELNDLAAQCGIGESLEKCIEFRPQHMVPTLAMLVRRECTFEKPVALKQNHEVKKFHGRIMNSPIQRSRSWIGTTIVILTTCNSQRV